jgi:hypothetical protein
MHDVSKTVVPPNISALFTPPLSQVHEHNTRSSTRKNFHVEYSGLDVQSKSFSRMGGRIWIAFLQNYVKNQRITLKKFYIESYFKY